MKQTKYIKYSLLLIIVFLCKVSFSQELNCRIQVNASKLQAENTQRTVYEDMQKALFEFLNERVWTNNVFSTNERIECNFLLNLTERISADEFKATLQITYNRPAYNTGYDSPMLNILDKKVRFRYAEGEPLEFSESTHSELVCLLAYYVYIILGFDYDSFSNMGGTPYFEKAEKIVSNAQSSSSTGWKSFEDRKNRYWLVENLLNNDYTAIREFSYKYHRLNLDRMHNKPAEVRSAIVEDLKPLLKMHRKRPSAYITQIFFDAKSDELVNIFSEAYGSEGQQAYNILKEIDPGHINKYEKIIKKN